VSEQEAVRESCLSYSSLLEICMSCRLEWEMYSTTDMDIVASA
jgi:hypothetical protein